MSRATKHTCHGRDTSHLVLPTTQRKYVPALVLAVTLDGFNLIETLPLMQRVSETAVLHKIDMSIIIRARDGVYPFAIFTST